MLCIVIEMSTNWLPFCLIFMLQTCIVCVFRCLIFIPSNHNSNLCHHLNNIVQYKATTCSPQFVVVYQGWQYVDSGSTLKYHIIGNFCLHSSMGAKWGLWCIRVWLYFTCCLCKRKLHWSTKFHFFFSSRNEMSQFLCKLSCWTRKSQWKCFIGYGFRVIVSYLYYAGCVNL